MEAPEGIGIASLPRLYNARLTAKPIYFNVMVAGGKGLGKTTFMNNFLGKNILKMQPFAETETKKFWYDEQLCNIQTSIIDLREQDTNIKMRVVEIDGIGDHVTNRGIGQPLRWLMHSLFEDYQEQFSRMVKAQIVDRRIHLCFYFLEPSTAVGCADLEAMKAISSYCSIIPVIAKSDTIDSRSIPRIKKAVRDALDANGVFVYEDLKSGSETPFTVVSGPIAEDEIKNDREYPWGAISVRDFRGNEFKALRDFVLMHSAWNLIQETDFYYNNYRASRMAAQIVNGRDANGKIALSKDAAGKEAVHNSLMIKMEQHKNEILSLKNKLKEKREIQEQ
ncbi:hypothetical protein ENBRE01_1189 [Enteropsectra breve]|nr:hypothetical protein ENBRE01_1189 [Enteropsectra breve]